MKNHVTTVVVAVSMAVASMSLSAKACAGEVLDRVLAAQTLTVAVGSDWGALSHLNDQHELDGDDVEVAKGIADYLGVKIKFVTPGWDIIEAGQWGGRWDMAMGQMTPTNDRAKKFAFPAMYFYEGEVAVVHKDSKATKPSDLEGKIVGVRAGTLGDLYANHKLTPAWIGAKPIQYQFTAGQVKAYPSANSLTLDDLRLGDGVRLDGVITEGTTAAAAVKSGYPLKVIGDPLFYAPGAVTIERGDKEFNDKVAAAVKKMKDDGTLAKLSVKWFGGDFSVDK
jgi:polar amino acid transport system substrate-binding protein